jgi:hypothetical protein
MARSKVTAPAGETRVDTFVRGILSGAIVGAVIAGSAIRERRRRRSALAVSPGAEPGEALGHAPDQAAGTEPAPG